MKWNNLFEQKNKAGFALLALLLMMAMVIFAHKKNLSQLQYTLTSIYSDRLVAGNYLYNLSHEIYKKKLHLDEVGKIYSAQNDSINRIIRKYEKTLLTTEESKQFSSLKAHLQLSANIESQIRNSSTRQEEIALRSQLRNQYDIILTDLNNLTSIQISEGQNLIAESNRIVASDNITSRLELGLLIIFGLLIMLIFSVIKSRMVRTAPSLN